MLIVHHLADSRSQRILWLLEELGLDYEIRKYPRDPQTRLAPPELKAVSALGKAPVLQDDARTIIESGAVVEYVLQRYGQGRLQPAPGTDAYWQYLQWLHYAEGSAMLPLMLNLYVSRLGPAGAPLQPRIDGEIANHLGYVEQSLHGRQWLVGHEPTGADIQMSFVGEAAAKFGRLGSYPGIEAWVKRCQARPAYVRALERGGEYGYVIRD